MWPAMWPGYPNPGNSFFADDPLNQKIADEYGIVISTSHHEPMQRAMNEWFADNPDGSWSWVKNKEKIREFFEEGIKRAKDYESYITLGMRGDGDREMAVDDPPAVLRDVLEHQRSIIEETCGKETGVKRIYFETLNINTCANLSRAHGLVQGSPRVLRRRFYNPQGCHIALCR
jgi:hypothetical protein